MFSGGPEWDVLRRELLGAVGAAGVAGVAGCTAPSADRRFVEGFESGLGDWEPDAAIGPEVDIEAFEWDVGVSDAEASAGERSLRIFTEGDHDDGVAWAEHAVPVETGRSYRVEVTGRLWSESESFNTLRDVVVRLGPDPPESEADFPDPGVNTTGMGETPYGGLREPLWLAEGWREYGFEWTSPELATDTLHLAVGVAVIWEADATHYVDELSVAFEPR